MTGPHAGALAIGVAIGVALMLFTGDCASDMSDNFICIWAGLGGW